MVLSGLPKWAAEDRIGLYEKYMWTAERDQQKKGTGPAAR